MTPLLILALLAAAPKNPLAGTDSIPAPLGQIGDVVQEIPEGGTPGGEQVVTSQLEGCDRHQALYLSRFVAGAAMAGAQIQAWLEKTGPSAPVGLERRLFGSKRRLIEAVTRARSSAPAQLLSCQQVPLDDGWRLRLAKAPEQLCKGERASPSIRGAWWFMLPNRASHPPAIGAVVQLNAAPPDRSDRCRPRLSAVLFDEAGVARLSYHADFGGALYVELLGDRCERVGFRFKVESQRFEPELMKAARGCTARP